MDQIAAWFGQERLDKNLAAIQRFWAGEERFLVYLQADCSTYRQHYDEAAALPLIAPTLKTQAELPDPALPIIFGDWGTVSTARYWGGELDMSGDFIYIKPAAHTLEAALALEPLPVDAPKMDAAKAVQRWRSVCEQLSTDQIWLRTPDMQGVLNTAGLVLNQEELFMTMYTDPERLHAFLDRVTDFLIDYALYLRRATHNHICGNIWPYTFITPDQGVSITEDMMPLLSAEKYKEFGLPYLKRISDALGGLVIHCCGDWGRHVENLLAAEINILAVEFHHPSTTLEEVRPLAEAGVVLIPYLLQHKQDRWAGLDEYWRWLLANTPDHYRYWFAIDAPGAAQPRTTGHGS